MKKYITPAAVMIVIGTALCFPLVQKAMPESDTWKIGLLVCLSGDCARDGTDAMRGAKIAAEELNSKGGVLGKKIEFVIQDTNEAVSGAKAVGAYRVMRLDRNLHYFIGPSWTPAGLALAPIIAKEKDVIIASPSLGAPEFHKAGDNIFNLRGTDETASRSEARYAISKGIRRAAIMSSQQPWEAQQAVFFEDEFKKLGGEILAKEEPLPTVTDVKGEALKIMRSKPDAVFLASVILMSRAARELRDLQYKGLQIGSNIDETRISDGAGALNGTVFFSFQKPSSEFREKFHALFGESPEPAGAIAYDTVYAFSKSVERAGKFDTSATKKTMLALDFDGASGRIRFDNERCAIRTPQGWQVAGLGYGPLDSSTGAK